MFTKSKDPETVTAVPHSYSYTCVFTHKLTSITIGRSVPTLLDSSFLSGGKGTPKVKTECT